MLTSSENKDHGRTGQFLIPAAKEIPPAGKYDIYPSFRIDDNLIHAGFESLAERIIGHKLISIDGFTGVFIELFRERIDGFLLEKGCRCRWISTTDYLKPEAEILSITAPFSGGDDPLFGSKTTLDLEDFFLPGFRGTFRADQRYDITILIGPGASLMSTMGFLVYIDLPKNELQFRSRAGSVTNLGLRSPGNPREMYKRFYFIDWVVLNRHKQKILPAVDIFVDGQRPEMPVWMDGQILREALGKMSRIPFRTRPWFEPGAWGGSWIKNNIPGLNADVPNYAWSFELITPENGLLIESSSLLCEVSFDCLMYLHAEAVLGDCFDRYGTVFPIRFDFLDTFDGGNLSLQCHPRPHYIRDHFGENFTQEETYYILDTKENAGVYLGFREGIDPGEFRRELETSFLEKKEFVPEKYVIKHIVNKHDLLLIPYGTIHGSGRNNLVLEISTTPYIFTFKMYDWLRPDLDGKPRPLNIQRGMENLFFERNGDYVDEKLISKPVLIEAGPGWELFHMPTHETHSYDVHRYHFRNSIEVATNNKCLVMSLTEGKTIDVESLSGTRQSFSYAETFVVPASAGRIRIINNSDHEAIVVKAFMK